MLPAIRVEWSGIAECNSAKVETEYQFHDSTYREAVASRLADVDKAQQSLILSSCRLWLRRGNFAEIQRGAFLDSSNAALAAHEDRLAT